MILSSFSCVGADRKLTITKLNQDAARIENSYWTRLSVYYSFTSLPDEKGLFHTSQDYEA
jgi:hypothetical protein